MRTHEGPVKRPILAPGGALQSPDESNEDPPFRHARGAPQGPARERPFNAPDTALHTLPAAICASSLCGLHGVETGWNNQPRVACLTGKHVERCLFGPPETRDDALPVLVNEVFNPGNRSWARPSRLRWDALARLSAAAPGVPAHAWTARRRQASGLTAACKASAAAPSVPAHTWTARRRQASGLTAACKASAAGS